MDVCLFFRSPKWLSLFQPHNHRPVREGSSFYHVFSLLDWLTFSSLQKGRRKRGGKYLPSKDWFVEPPKVSGMVQAAERVLGAKPSHPHPHPRLENSPPQPFPPSSPPRVHFAKTICFLHNLRVSEDHHRCLNAPDINRITDRAWHPFREHFCIIAVFSPSGDRNPDASSLFLFFTELSALLRVSALPALVPQLETLRVFLVSRWACTRLFRSPFQKTRRAGETWVHSHGLANPGPAGRCITGRSWLQK